MGLFCGSVGGLFVWMKILAAWWVWVSVALWWLLMVPFAGFSCLRV